MITWLNVMRREHNMTVEQVADALGMTVAAYEKLEAGNNQKRFNRMANVCKLADLFNTSTDRIAGLIISQKKAFEEEQEGLTPKQELIKIIIEHPELSEKIAEMVKGILMAKEV